MMDDDDESCWKAGGGQLGGGILAAWRPGGLVGLSGEGRKEGRKEGGRKGTRIGIGIGECNARYEMRDARCEMVTYLGW